MYPLLYRRRELRRRCAGLLAFALGLRLLLTPGLAERSREGFLSALGSREVAEAVLLLQTGRLPDRPGEAAEAPELSAETAAPGPETAAPPETADPAETEVPTETASAETQSAQTSPSGNTAEAPAPFTAAEAEAIRLRGNCTYDVDKAALLLSPLPWQLQEGPKVLIVHTHSCEAYTPTEGWEYEPTAEYRTLDTARSVVAVGGALQEALEARGIETIHDETICDYPHYNSSYAMARKQIKQWLAQYPSIVLVIDLHRDALEQPVRETAEADGQILAPLMLVVGTDEGGLEHPGWRDNLSAALKLQALMERSCPGLMKKPSLRKERFNGDLSPGEFIIEVGSTENTLPEALAAMPYLAEGVASLLRCAAQRGE